MGLTTSDQGRGSKQRRSQQSNADLFLDEVRLPYGACPAVLEASASPSPAAISDLGFALRRQLGAVHRVPIESTFTFRDVDSELDRILARTVGPILVFPPSAAATYVHTFSGAREILDLSRGFGASGRIDLESASDLPTDSVAVVDSPSDPLGALLSSADAVRISRACKLLIVDERYAEFAGQTLLPLALEFDNIVVVRSFDTWAGLQDLPCAWAVASSRTCDRFALASSEVSATALVAGLATLENLASVNATISLMREERSRLYRLLRKLLFLEPLPSWGPFLSARVTIGTRVAILEELRKRGVHVYAPPEPVLQSFIRFGIGSRSEMDRLRTALVDLAPTILGTEVMPH